ncbi:MAG: cytochrome c biogenesis protein ResB [Syntrophales bacterium]|jgi:cytochrome c biogenesis protein
MPKQANPIWSFFSSGRLTVVLLILIVLLSIAGTLIPQQEEAQELIERLSPGVSNMLQYLQIFDLYHSTIFHILIWLLSMNLVVCSLNRLPLSWKQASSPPFLAPVDLFINLPLHQTLITDANQDTTLQVLETLLKTRFRVIWKNDTGKGIILFGQHGQLSHLGVYVVHMSILVMIMGAVIGSIFGFEAYVNLGEGQSTSEVELKGNRGIQKMDFAVRCDKFIVDFYENGMPKTYRSDLSFIKNGQVVYQGPVLVNHPISFEKIRFYQASYSESPGGFDRVEPTYNTGLQVVRDPGAPLVAAGGFLMVIGLMMALWMVHQRIWIWMGPIDGKTLIRVAGRSNRNKAGLERKIRFLCLAIREKLKT